MARQTYFSRWMLVLAIFWFISLPTTAQISQHTLEHGGMDRQYQLYISPGYDADSPAYLIMILHGGSMTGTDMLDMTSSRFNEWVDEQHLNAIVVYPDGIGKGWNDGRVREQRAYNEGIDDVDFLLTLVDTIASDYNIQTDALFLAGFSNGAGMSYRVACEHPERVAAIAPVSNMIASTLPCTPASPVALLSIIGDEDPILPLEGGDLFFGEMPMGSVLSLDETLAVWHDVNACQGYGDALDWPNADSEDGTIIQVTEALDCEQPVTSMIVHRGGHTWPGSAPYLPIETYGQTSMDMNAADVIMAFFQQVGLE